MELKIQHAARGTADSDRTAHSAARTLVRTSVWACWHDFGFSVGLTWAPSRLSTGFLTCSGAPQAPLGRSWRLLEALGACKIKIHRPCRCPRSFQRAPRSIPRHDPSALSVSGRLTCHDLSCLSVSGSLPECSEVTIYRACRCLEASRGAPAPIDGPMIDLIVGGLGPALQRSLDH